MHEIRQDGVDLWSRNPPHGCRTRGNFSPKRKGCSTPTGPMGRAVRRTPRALAQREHWCAKMTVAGEIRSGSPIWTPGGTRARFPLVLVATPPSPGSPSRSKMIAVGTRVAPRPPHRSGRAQLRHPAPTSGVWRRTARSATDEGSWVSEGNRRPVSPFAPTRSHPSDFVVEAIAARAR